MMKQPAAFTALDVELSNLVLSTAQELAGAPAPAKLDELLLELLRMSRVRDQTLFHLGLRDAVLRRQWWEGMPDETPERRAWYASGYLSGLEHQQRWAEIVEVLQQHGAVRRVGKTTTGPGYHAVPAIVRALVSVNRPAEAIDFVGPDALIELGIEFVAELHEVATSLLRMGEAQVAKAYYRKLVPCMTAMVALGGEETRVLTTDIQRRYAHSLRETGESLAAQHVLSSLNDHSALTPTQRVHVLVDLGLIQAGCRRLGDVLLPDHDQDFEGRLEALKAGEGFFRQALAVESADTGHAEYCLGVMALLVRNPESVAAARHLDAALATFLRAPERYSAHGVLNHCRLCLGMALAMTGDPSAARRANDLLFEAALAGQYVRLYHLADVLTGLSIGGHETASQLLSMIADKVPGEYLDRLIVLDEGQRSPEVVGAALERIRDSGLGHSFQADSYRRLLPLLVRQGEREKALELLNTLEEWAIGGTGSTEFIELLADPRSHEPWSDRVAREVRTSLLLSAGRLGEALELLKVTFYEHAQRHDERSLVLAEAAIASMIETGLQGAGQDERRRLTAITAQRRDRPAPHRALVRVFFIGGSHGVGRHVDDVCAELARRDNQVTVEFDTEQWNSNWGRRVDDMLERAGRFDVLVLSPWIRTGLGEHLRSRSPVPWWPCTGRGTQSIADSIMGAVAYVRRLSESPDEGEE